MRPRDEDLHLAASYKLEKKGIDETMRGKLGQKCTFIARFLKIVDNLHAC